MLAVPAMLFILVFCQAQASYQDSSYPDSQAHQQRGLATPLVQYESGTAIKNIKCAEGLGLALRAENGYPVCISQGVQEKLAGRGFIMPLARALSQPPLLQSMEQGPSPLTIGFLLTDHDINTIKDWTFGDNKTDYSTHSYIENHLYTLPHRNDTKWTYKGHVVVMDENYVKQYNVTFTVTVSDKYKTYISNFDQYEGILYQDDADGFDVSTANSTLPSLRWEWGDGNVYTGQEYANPFYSYSRPSNYTGNVTLTPVGSTNPVDLWPFGVLVLDKSQPRPTRIYDDVYPSDPQPAVGTDRFRTDQKLCFYFSTAQNNDDSKTFVTGKNGLCGIKNLSSQIDRFSDIANIKSTRWSFGNVSIPYNGSIEELIPAHIFKTNGTFSVNCTVYYTDNTNVSLSKTISILPPRTLVLVPDHGTVNDVIHVSGSYYGPENEVDVWLRVGKPGTHLGVFTIDNLTRTFSGDFTLPNTGLHDLQRVYATDSFGHDIADANFTIK